MRGPEENRRGDTFFFLYKIKNRDPILFLLGVPGQSPRTPDQTNNVPRSGAVHAATIVTEGGDAGTAAPAAQRLERDRAQRGPPGP